MPVSRNLSLPSSIEARKFKKRPDALHCLSMPCANANSTWVNNDKVTSDKQGGESPAISFHSSNFDSAETSKNAEPKLARRQRPRSPVSRPTLSQPCMSENKNVGATTIFPHLFLGSQQDVMDEILLKENNISNVLNVSSNCTRPNHIDDQHFLRISVKDNFLEQITPYLDSAIQFIESVRERNEKVLVHCLAGVSRSATVAVAYVMHYLRLSLDDAYRFVQDKRPTISPNLNFLGQLLEYENKLRDQNHFSKPRTGSLPVDIRDQLRTRDSEERPKKASLLQSAAKSVENSSNFVMPATVSCSSQRPPVSPTSSFCRRRKGPALNKFNFLKDSSDKVFKSVPSRHNSSHQGGGAGVVLDLHVTVPTSEVHSRRLGSDGVEDEEEEMEEVLNSSQKFNSLPHNMNFVTGKLFGNSSCPTPPILHRLREDLSITTRSFTAPNTPAVIRDDIFPQNISPLDRYFLRDVEMSESSSSEFGISPRHRSSTHPATFYLAKRSSSRSCDTLQSNSNFDKNLASRKSKSPKNHRKSSNLNVRQLYQFGFSSKQGSASLHHATILCRNRPRDKLSIKTEPLRSFSVPNHCESPGTERLSNLTLHSPAVCPSNPLDQMEDSAEMKDVSLAPTCDTKINVFNAATIKAKTGEPFRLASSLELKPKWRKRTKNNLNNNRSSNSSVTANGSKPTTPDILNRSCNNNLEIISCS